MWGTIVVGVSDAAASRSALDWAVRHARATNAELEMLSVIGGAVGASGEDELLASISRATEEALAREAEEATASGVPVRVRVEHGDPVALLLEASKSAQLLVIGGEPGGHGRRGRHGTRIAAGADCPVVVVPDTDLTDRRGIVVGVDGSETSDAAIEFAAAEAARSGEPLTLVSAWLPVAVPGDFGAYPDLYLTDLEGIAQETVDRVRERVQAAHPQLEILTVAGEGEPSILIGEQARTARLTVVGSHGRGALARFLLGSVSEEVVSHLITATAVVR